MAYSMVVVGKKKYMASYAWLRNPERKKELIKRRRHAMGYGSSKEFQMMVRLEKLSHKTSNPELDYNTAGQIQIHQPTLKNK